MDKSLILRKTKSFVRKKFEAEGTGHDWWHIERVLENTRRIAKGEKSADLFIVQLGALLHDIADFKFHGGNETIGGTVAARWLTRVGANHETIKQVTHIVDNVSFKGLGVRSKMKSLEGKIVQDADRLDALGAMGIARTFAYGGYKQRPIYNPEGKTRNHRTFKQYQRGGDSSLHHFYEKLLHLKDLMNTKTGRKFAARRHAFLKAYLKEFHAEWDGRR